MSHRIRRIFARIAVLAALGMLASMFAMDPAPADEASSARRLRLRSEGGGPGRPGPRDRVRGSAAHRPSRREGPGHHAAGRDRSDRVRRLHPVGHAGPPPGRDGPGRLPREGRRPRPGHARAAARHRHAAGRLPRHQPLLRAPHGSGTGTPSPSASASPSGPGGEVQDCEDFDPETGPTCGVTLPVWNGHGYARAVDAPFGEDIVAEAVARCTGTDVEFMTGAAFSPITGGAQADPSQPNQPIDIGLGPARRRPSGRPTGIPQRTRPPTGATRCT